MNIILIYSNTITLLLLFFYISKFYKCKQKKDKKKNKPETKNFVYLLICENFGTVKGCFDSEIKAKNFIGENKGFLIKKTAVA